MAKKVKASKKGQAESFSTSISDPAFAAWLYGQAADESSELVTATTVLGTSAVLRAVTLISSTIAGLPLRTYRRKANGDRARVDSVFDDPYPAEGNDPGMTPFSWTETVVIHELLWRKAFLWHLRRDRNGFVSAYRPMVPDLIKVKSSGHNTTFEYTDDNREKRTVGRETITHIPGPSLDTVDGHPFLGPARAIFSGAISGDKAAQAVLRRGIRIAGLITPAEGEEVEGDEGEEILQQLRDRVVGREHAGDIAFVNRHLDMKPWTPNNVESQWNESRQFILGEVGRLFGIPPHLLNDIEKQTSWGTGVAEQNLGLARYTLMGWTSRIEQALSRQLPRGQFVEFDYKGLLQGTPAQEIELLIKQVEGGLLTRDEARSILNLPKLTAAQKRELNGPPAAQPPQRPQPLPSRDEATA